MYAVASVVPALLYLQTCGNVNPNNPNVCARGHVSTECEQQYVGKAKWKRCRLRTPV